MISFHTIDLIFDNNLGLMGLSESTLLSFNSYYLYQVTFDHLKNIKIKSTNRNLYDFVNDGNIY
ncbi:hypothetical protein BH23THE1_BH23THE1_24870 [soil metagenome]